MTPTVTGRFETVLAEVLNRADAHACVPEETIRRISDALVDAELAVVTGEELKANNAAWAADRMAAMRNQIPRITDECTCVLSCADDPTTRCSLSGEWHVHPDAQGPGFGLCPVHPGAPGDR